MPPCFNRFVFTPFNSIQSGSRTRRLGPCFSGLSPPILCYMPSPYGRTDEYGLTMFHQWHLTYADFGGLCSTPVNPCGFDVPRGQRRIRSRSVRLTSRRWPQPCLGHALLGLYTFAYAAPSSAHPSPHLGRRCPQGFTPSLYSQSVLEQGQAKPLPDGNLPHIAIDAFMSHDLLTLHH